MYKIEAREQNINGILRNGFFLALVFNNQCNIIAHGDDFNTSSSKM
jgi:hypothetical protein